jgi:HK97 family phage major capsid protein
MKTKEMLIAEKGDLQNQIESVQAVATSEERELTSEECDTVNALLDKQEAIDKQIKTAERLEANAVTVPQTAAQAGIVAGGPVTGSPFRSHGHFLQAVIAAGIRDREGDRIGEFECGIVSEQLRNYQRELKNAAAGHNETTPSEGGFMVGTDFGSTLLADAMENANIPAKCTQMPISANSNRVSLPAVDETSRATGSRWGGVQVYMAHEAASVTATKTKLRNIVLELNKMMGLTYLTDELMQDAAALEAWVRIAFAMEFGFAIDDKLIRGSGAGEPMGILNAPALRTIAKESGQAADTIQWENIQKMYTFALGTNLEWYINRECLPQLMSMSQPVGTGGVPVWLPANGASGRPQDTLMGLPINYIEQASALGDKGDIMLADFSQYLFSDKGGLQTASSIHVNFTTDETALRFVYRLDGQPVKASPITPYKGASGATYSSFIALASRA